MSNELEVQIKYIQIADFRKKMADYLSDVENGNIIIIKKHKKPIVVLKKFTDEEIGD